MNKPYDSLAISGTEKRLAHCFVYDTKQMGAERGHKKGVDSQCCPHLLVISV